MIKPQRADKRSLLVQLESYRLILEANLELFETNRQIREQISHRMGRLGAHLDELDRWERMKDQVNYNLSAEQAYGLLEEIKALLQQILYQDPLPGDDGSQLVEG